MCLFLMLHVFSLLPFPCDKDLLSTILLYHIFASQGPFSIITFLYFQNVLFKVQSKEDRIVLYKTTSSVSF
jgi:hypothetical protein